jgi:Uma2 family endonuclease
MVAARTLPIRERHASEAEQRMIVHGVPWKTYVLLREGIDEPRLKMTYCEGVLELMSPSNAHEEKKKLLARLLELYAFLTRTAIYAYGSTTFKREAKERGVEPDECYCFGKGLREGGFPELVLEVIETSPLLDKLHVYDGLEVPEVWLLEKGKLTIYRRKAKGGYEKVRRSVFVPNLDPRVLEQYATRTDQDAAIHEFAAHVKKERAPKPKRRKRR